MRRTQTPHPSEKYKRKIFAKGKRDYMIAKDLLDILACPVCKLPIALAQDQQSLKCAQCRRSFPIRDGIPVLLVDQATLENR
jgi:uncharacterized protein YbaR (Trm112 family)